MLFFAIFCRFFRSCWGDSFESAIGLLILAINKFPCLEDPSLISKNPLLLSGWTNQPNTVPEQVKKT